MSCQRAQPCALGDRLKNNIGGNTESTRFTSSALVFFVSFSSTTKTLHNIQSKLFVERG